MTKDDHSLGYISLHRSILDWEWYGDANTSRLFIHLLLTAEFEDGEWRGREIKRGQRMCSVSTLSSETGLTVREVRTALSRLEMTNELTNEKTPQGTAITIKNYDKFQRMTNQTTNKRQTKMIDKRNDKPIDKGNDKRKNPGDGCAATGLGAWIQPIDKHNDKPIDKGNDKPTFNNKDNKKNIYIRSNFPRYGEFENVHLSDEELDRLKGIAPVAYQDYIERLSAYMASTGKTYKNHYATIRNWFRRDGLINKTTEEDDSDVL